VVRGYNRQELTRL